jgi:AcrR family transcriptional regulator
VPQKKAAAKKAKPKKRAPKQVVVDSAKSAARPSLTSLRPERRDSRHALIDVAIEIIQAHGIDALRIEDVCERVGVSKGSLYWHFGDREGLIREALLEHMYRLGDEQLAVLNSAVDRFTTRDDYLMKIAGAFVDPFDASQVETRWQRLELIAGSRRDPKLAPIMAEIQRRHHRYLTDIMEKASKQGVLRPDVDPKAVAAMLVAVGLGSNVLSLLGEEGPRPEAWTASLIVLVDALFPPK